MFVDAIFAWAMAAAKRGAFDDGPVVLASPGVEFSGTRARFYIDTHLSGQDTINWLSLAVLDFGEEVQAVTGIYFGSEPEFLDAMLGPLKHEWESVGFPIYGPAVSKGSVITPPDTHVPKSAKHCREFASQKFPVLKLKIWECESFISTVYFGRPLQEGERKEIASLIDAWFLLGAYGGFGGAGTHSTRPVKFDDATDSLLLHADMGDADPEIAMPVLIRILEGFESTGVPIDALVLGRENNNAI